MEGGTIDFIQPRHEEMASFMAVADAKFSGHLAVCLATGGPGATHEYLEAFDSYFPAAGLEYYYYDQLGSLYSDQPDEPDLWEVSRFVDEVEQVRRALGLGPDNFYLYGQSWGGCLALEYALKYQQHLAGLIVSNMMTASSIRLWFLM